MGDLYEAINAKILQPLQPKKVHDGEWTILASFIQSIKYVDVVKFYPEFYEK